MRRGDRCAEVVTGLLYVEDNAADMHALNQSLAGDRRARTKFCRRPGHPRNIAIRLRSKLRTPAVASDRSLTNCMCLCPGG